MNFTKTFLKLPWSHQIFTLWLEIVWLLHTPNFKWNIFSSDIFELSFPNRWVWRVFNQNIYLMFLISFCIFFFISTRRLSQIFWSLRTKPYWIYFAYKKWLTYSSNVIFPMSMSILQKNYANQIYADSKLRYCFKCF